MKKNIYYIADKKDIYCKMTIDALVDELRELYPNFTFSSLAAVKDVIKADLILICDGSISKKILWTINVLKKKFILYCLRGDGDQYKQLVKRAALVVSERKSDFGEYYPSPILLSDTATSRQVDRIWRKEKMLSKRGSIGVLGLSQMSSRKQKLLEALDLLIEDLDLNMIFIPLSVEKTDKDVALSIKYSANVRNVRAEEYSSKELLGAMGKVDLFIVKDERGAMCAMAVNKPFVCVAEDGAVEKCFNDFAGEEILFDIDKISGEELYTKIKIAWVHKEAIAVEMLKKNQELKKLAVSGIKKLNEAAGL